MHTIGTVTSERKQDYSFMVCCEQRMIFACTEHKDHFTAACPAVTGRVVTQQRGTCNCLSSFFNTTQRHTWCNDWHVYF